MLFYQFHCFPILYCERTLNEQKTAQGKQPVLITPAPHTSPYHTERKVAFRQICHIKEPACSFKTQRLVFQGFGAAGVWAKEGRERLSSLKFGIITWKRWQRTKIS